jgi:hypothetical protein
MDMARVAHATPQMSQTSKTCREARPMIHDRLLNRLDLAVLSTRFIFTAVAFFLVGVALGMYMGIAQDFRFTHVHAHLNLLGWVALGLAGLLYRVHPQLQEGWLPQAHYWLHTVGLVVFMGGFAWGIAAGAKQVLPVALGASAVSVGVLLFAVNVFTRLGRAGEKRAQ